SVATVNGAEVTVNESMGTVTINNANVVAADIEASNGVIHVIDAVLLP
ncbi:MAG: fasciclin domain-containing protein, partial [Actinomycetota bacterium]|nr:fasciclin domain-containing protein [Actinomycetota bacterium]